MSSAYECFALQRDLNGEVFQIGRSKAFVFFRDFAVLHEALV